MSLLTDSEVEELTGYSRPSDQCRALREHGILFVERRDGKPRTTWFNVNHPISVRGYTGNDEHNFEALLHG